jgi:hypothetical protein
MRPLPHSRPDNHTSHITDDQHNLNTRYPT